MRRIIPIVFMALLIAGCGEQAATTSPTVAATPTSGDQAQITKQTATIRPTDVPRPTRTPSPSPAPLPTQTVAPEITASPAELDTPTLIESTAPATPKPQPAPNSISDPNQPVRLVIKGVGIDAAPISVGLDQKNVPVVPKHDVGWYNLSAEPGQGENVVFWGHVLRFKSAPTIPAPFARIKEATVGTPLTVYTADGSAHNYVVTEQVWVTPDQVQYILPVGSERVTLVSCIGDKVVQNGSVELTHRLITIAEPVK
ncbi:MAG: sortase [Herpetosiphonaceae bacterium]|nr:sortase [Herpetosiphonaceae bacterium]